MHGALTRIATTVGRQFHSSPNPSHLFKGHPQKIQSERAAWLFKGPYETTYERRQYEISIVEIFSFSAHVRVLDRIVDKVVKDVDSPDPKIKQFALEALIRLSRDPKLDLSVTYLERVFRIVEDLNEKGAFKVLDPQHLSDINVVGLNIGNDVVNVNPPVLQQARRGQEQTWTQCGTVDWTPEFDGSLRPLLSLGDIGGVPTVRE